MPISIDEYRTPTFTTYKAKQPFSEDVRAKFDDANSNNPTRRYRQDYFPQAGYNPNSNSPNIVQVNINIDEVTLPRY